MLYHCLHFVLAHYTTSENKQLNYFFICRIAFKGVIAVHMNKHTTIIDQGWSQLFYMFNRNMQNHTIYGPRVHSLKFLQTHTIHIFA